MIRKTVIFTLSLSLALCSTTLRAADAVTAATCEKHPFKEVQTFTPFSITVRQNSKKVVYDDLSCGFKWREKQCSSGQGAFDADTVVYDFNTLAEIDIAKATFVQSPAVSAPMGSGLAAFADPAAADAFLAQKGDGKKLTYQEVLLLNWK